MLYAGLVVAVIAVGLATRACPALLPRFLGKYPGDALWAVMLFCGLGLIFPRWSTAAVTGCALVVCGGVEVLKLWPSPSLAELRHTTLGHLVLGHTFTWQNLPAYAVGVAVAAGCEIGLRRVGRRRGESTGGERRGDGTDACLDR